MARRTEDEGEEMDDRLAEAQAQIESLQTAAADAEARARLPKAAVKYREAKLASAPDVPHDRVPQAESLAEIDEGFSRRGAESSANCASGCRKSGSPRG